MKVLILGCGYTGSRLARLLLEQEIPVCLTTRSGECPKSIKAPCFAFSDDYPLLPDQALAGVTHVLHSIPPDVQGIDPVAVYLLPALEKANLQWFGYLSTTGVYGDVQGAWVDEQTPTHPQQYRSEHRVAAEQKFLHALPTHIFRLPGIYGPGRSVIDRLKAGKAQRIARPGHVFSRIHVEDIVGTLWASMKRPNPSSIYNVADDEPTEPENLLVEASKLLGITPPEAVPFEQAALSPMAATFWSECRRVSNQKIKTELGVVLKYPTYREGLKAILLES